MWCRLLRTITLLSLRRRQWDILPLQYLLGAYYQYKNLLFGFDIYRKLSVNEKSSDCLLLHLLQNLSISSDLQKGQLYMFIRVPGFAVGRDNALSKFLPHFLQCQPIFKPSFLTVSVINAPYNNLGFNGGFCNWNLFLWICL